MFSPIPCLLPRPCSIASACLKYSVAANVSSLRLFRFSLSLGLNSLDPRLVSSHYSIIVSERAKILDNRDFWLRLEFDACRWIDRSSEANLRPFWIDGFLPDDFTNTKRGADIQGLAWVGKGPRAQYRYRFNASVPQKILSRPEPVISIESLVIDEAERTLQVTLV
jgi:hypothetical protein